MFLHSLPLFLSNSGFLTLKQLQDIEIIKQNRIHESESKLKVRFVDLFLYLDEGVVPQ